MSTSKVVNHKIIKAKIIGDTFYRDKRPKYACLVTTHLVEE